MWCDYGVGGHEGQKRASGPLKLEVRAVVWALDVGAGTEF